MADRIVQDGMFVRNKYGQENETYLIKTQIEENDRVWARMTKTEHLLLPWDCDLSIPIHSANLLRNDEKEFPPILMHQTELYWLSLPSHLAKQINSASFCHQLRGLQIANGDLKLNHGVMLENLLHLSTGSGRAYFTKDNLPNLRSLSCKYREGLLPELYKYEQFDKLSLNSVHNNHIFNEIYPVRDLYGLQIHRGKLESTAYISTIKSLHAVELDDLPKLTNLDDLTELPELEYLEVGYCKHIRNWDFLLALKKLKRLWITATSYKDYPPQKLLDMLREKNINVPLKGA